MRDQFLADPIDHLDFHQRLGAECDALERIIKTGGYSPGESRRILVEKSKGLCRQLVIPNVRDAIVLQALSDGLYSDIRGKAPTRNSFFEPQDHTFSKQSTLFTEPGYGSFRAWLNFQREIFRFSKERDYVVVTDIANFYDSISYTHLRNVISDLIEVREPVLDMLIYVLSGLLWQPDYMPRIEIGLPQINLDAPRILAHCFLYELDEYLEREVKGDFVRFMDDIDVGVDSIQAAKRLLKNIDLVLQTRHVRLNSGKTLILKREEAIKHFRVRENALLDYATDRINAKVAKGKSVRRERDAIARSIRVMSRRKQFDSGNGEKILKRMMSIGGRIGAEIDGNILFNVLYARPGSRTAVLSLIGRLPLTQARTTVVRKFVGSDMIVDDASYVEVANALVGAVSPRRASVDANIQKIREYYPTDRLFSLYGRIWLTSKFGSPDEMMTLLTDSRAMWSPDRWLGRLVGGLHPFFARDALEPAFRSLINTSGSSSAHEVYDFHDDLRRDPKRFDMCFSYLKAVNISRRSGVSHSRFLLLLSALANDAVATSKKTQLLKAHRLAWADAYHRALLKRSAGITVPATVIPVHPVP